NGYIEKPPRGASEGLLAPQDRRDLHVAPITTAGGFDATSGQGAGDAAHTGDAARLYFLDDGVDVGGERLGGLATGFYGRLAGCGEAGAAELDAAPLGGGKGGLGALRDCLALVFGDGGKDMDSELVRVRIVGCDERDAAVHQRRDKGEIAR